MLSRAGDLSGPAGSAPLVLLWFPVSAMAIGPSALYDARLALRLSDRGRQGLMRTYYAAGALFSGFGIYVAYEATACAARSSYYCRPTTATQAKLAFLAIVIGLMLAVPCIIAARLVARRDIVMATHRAGNE